MMASSVLLGCLIVVRVHLLLRSAHLALLRAVLPSYLRFAPRFPLNRIHLRLNSHPPLRLPQRQDGVTQECSLPDPSIDAVNHLLEQEQRSLDDLVKAFQRPPVAPDLVDQLLQSRLASSLSSDALSSAGCQSDLCMCQMVRVSLNSCRCTHRTSCSIPTVIADKTDTS